MVYITFFLIYFFTSYPLFFKLEFFENLVIEFLYIQLCFFNFITGIFLL